MTSRVYYSRSLTAEAERALHFHSADAAGWCTGCAVVGIRVRAGECDASLWAESILQKVAMYGEPRS